MGIPPKRVSTDYMAQITQLTPGPAFSQLNQLLPIRPRVGVIYSWLFRYTQQHTACFTENSIGPWLAIRKGHKWVLKFCRLDLKKTSPNMKLFVRIGRWWYVPRQNCPTQSISLFNIQSVHWLDHQSVNFIHNLMFVTLFSPWMK